MRVLSIISLVFTIIIVVALIVFFAIEKTIPLDWAKQTIAESTSSIKIADFESIENKNKFGCRKVITDYSYSETGIKTISARRAVKVEVVGVNANRIVRVVKTEYDLLMQPASETVTYYYYNGKKPMIFVESAEEIKVTDWENAIISALREAYPVDSTTGEFLYTEIVGNIERVSQIGVYVNGHIKDNEATLDLSYDFMNRQLKSIKRTEDTKAEGKVTATTVTEYQILFPTSLSLPEAVSK